VGGLSCRGVEGLKWRKTKKSEEGGRCSDLITNSVVVVIGGIVLVEKNFQ